MDLKTIEEWTIYKVISGSHAYGLNTPESDIDERGILIPPKEYYLSPFKNIDQFISNDPDVTIFALDKFIKLAVQNNPNVLELLFIDESLIKVLKPEAKILRDNRDLFLSAKCKFTYSGYAFSQLRRIKNHKKWIDNPPKEITRKELGLPEDYKVFSNPALHSMIDGFRNHLTGKTTEALMDIYPNKFNKDKLYACVSSALYEKSIQYFRDFALNHFVHMSKDVVRKDLKEIMVKEIEYFIKKKEWNQYQSWKKNRNVKRAELERKYGYDIKHATHLIRLMKQAEEILLKGTLTVNVSGVKEVVSVKNGEWDYDYLVNWAEDFDSKLEEIYQNKKYVVQHKPNVKKIEEIVLNILEDRYKGESQ